MKKLVPSIILTTIASTVLSGCVQFVPYEGKSLNPEARGITTVRSTPYGCKVLGEAEGKETTNPSTLYTRGSVTRETLRDSALNDLRNNAAEAIGKGKRITLRIVEEKPICINRCPLDEEGYAIESHITAIESAHKFLNVAIKISKKIHPLDLKRKNNIIRLRNIAAFFLP